MPKTVFITVETTLVDNNNKLIDSTIARIRQLKKEGYTVVLWSDKGRKYCESIVDLHNLKKVVDVCVSKPTLLIDSDDFPLRGSKLETPKYLKREFV